jgi:hypothetical protein
MGISRSVAKFFLWNQKRFVPLQNRFRGEILKQ